MPFKDFGCALRVMRRDVASGLLLYGEMHRFITALVLQQGGKVAQMPVRHHSRTAGKSKYNLTRTVRVLLDLMTVKFQGSYQTRPMHLFGLFGLVCGFLGFLGIAASVVMADSSYMVAVLPEPYAPGTTPVQAVVSVAPSVLPIQELSDYSDAELALLLERLDAWDGAPPVDPVNGPPTSSPSSDTVIQGGS